MDLRDLRLFVHLSKSLHFARSSRELHISASGLTRAIQRLEDELGVPLFERDNRTVRLTAAGQRCRDYAVSALEQWAELKSGLQVQASELQGALSLFCSVTASYSFLHELVQHFREIYPQVELQLHTGDSALALQRVVDEQEDMAIAALPARLPDTLEFLPLGESPLVCIGPAQDCPLSVLIANTDGRGEQDWQALPVIMPESGLARARLERWFSQRKLNPRIYAQVSGHEAMVSMVSLGCGVAVVPRVVVDNSPMRDRIRILPFMQELEPFSIGLCTMRRKFANPLVKAFWSVAQRRSGSQ
jgi:LysR family transcriptional regulator, positive regulator for ilvC